MHHRPPQPRFYPAATLGLDRQFQLQVEVDVEVSFASCGHVVRVPAQAERTLVDCPLCGGELAGEDTLLDSVSPFGTQVLPRPVLSASPRAAYYPPRALSAPTTSLPTLVSQPYVVVAGAAPPISRAAALLATAAPLHHAVPERPHRLIVPIPRGYNSTSTSDALWQIAFDSVGGVAKALDWSLRVAGRVDALLASKRGVYLTVAALLFLAAPLVEAAFNALSADYAVWFLSPLAGVVFLSLLAVMAIARVDAWRDDDGFSLGLLGAQLRLAAEGSQEYVASLVRPGAVGDRRCQLGVGLFGVGAISSALLALVSYVPTALGYEAAALGIARWVAGGVLLLGVAIFRWGYSAWKNASADSGASTSSDHASLAGSAMGQLPVLIDCGQQVAGATLERERALVDACPHAQVRQLVSAISCWKPARYRYESEYQTRLAWHLKRSLKARVESEAHIKNSRETGRVDLKVQNLLIEVKRDLKGTEADRTVGQLEKYLRIWGDRGPILLVLCSTNPEVARVKLVPALENMRRKGFPVVAMLAHA